MVQIIFWIHCQFNSGPARCTAHQPSSAFLLLPSDLMNEAMGFLSLLRSFSSCDRICCSADGPEPVVGSSATILSTSPAACFHSKKRCFIPFWLRTASGRRLIAQLPLRLSPSAQSFQNCCIECSTRSCGMLGGGGCEAWATSFCSSALTAAAPSNGALCPSCLPGGAPAPAALCMPMSCAETTGITPMPGHIDVLASCHSCAMHLPLPALCTAKEVGERFGQYVR